VSRSATPAIRDQQRARHAEAPQLVSGFERRAGAEGDGRGFEGEDGLVLGHRRSRLARIASAARRPAAGAVDEDVHEPARGGGSAASSPNSASS
jgi:hypothetical protein